MYHSPLPSPPWPTAKPVKLNEEELLDVDKRKAMDTVRIEEQKRFYEIARQRAAELDGYMEKFRRDIVESSKLTHSSSGEVANSKDTCLTKYRWIDKTFCGDPRKALHCRAQSAVPEIRRVASY